MKRFIAMILAAVLLLSLAACGKTEEKATEPGKENPEQIQVTDPTVTEPEETEAPAVPAADVEVLDLSKTRTENDQWDDATLLALSEYSTVKLWYDDAAAYPELAQVLDQLETMQRNSMDDEYENLLSFAREELDSNPDSFDTQTSRLDVVVRRADSVAISLLSDSWSDFGGIEDFRAMHGTNFDTATGRELAITDVIKDMSRVPDIVMEELYSHMWYGELTSETAVADYFRNTPADGISWTLDYNGVTFYFGDGDLTEPGNGRQTATIDFARYPELFEETYMAVPEAYAVELPLDESYFTDLDGDGDLEELQVTGWYDTVMDMYAKYGIYTDANGSFYYEDYCCDELQPYYVKTADGSHYLYLFCRFNEGPVPQMSLVVYDVADGELNRIGEKNMGPGYIPENINRMPLDPNSLWLDDFDGMAQDAMEYAVGPQGLPVLKSEIGIVFDPDNLTMIPGDRASFENSSWGGYAVVNAESGEATRLPCEDMDGTVFTVSMELCADGTGWLEYKGAYENITWDCDSNYSLWLIREDGQRMDLTPYTMGGESRLWLLMDLDGCLFWLYNL